MQPSVVRICSLVLWCGSLTGPFIAVKDAEALGRRCVMCPSVACTTRDCCAERLAECRQQVAGLEKEISRLTVSLAKCDEERKCLADKLCDTEKDRDRIQAELVRVTESLQHTRQELQDAQSQVNELKDKVAELDKSLQKAETDLAATNKLLASTEDDLAESEKRNIRLDERLRDTTRQIQDLQARLDRNSAWFWALAFLALFLVVLLLICLWFVRYRAWMLERSVDDARQQRERDLAELRELGNRYAGAKSRVFAYRRQVEEL